MDTKTRPVEHTQTRDETCRWMKVSWLKVSLDESVKIG